MAVILITGAAKRVGRAIAIALGNIESGAVTRAQQHKIIVHYNASSHEAHQVVADIIGNGGHAHAIKQDLFADNASTILFENAVKIYGRIDVIINSASIFMPDTLSDLSLDLWQKHQAIHVTVPMMLTHLLYNSCPDNAVKGDVVKNIINIIDQRVVRPTPEFFSYTASKMFMASLTKQCAVACSPKVRVNAIAPGSTLPSMRQSQEDFNQQAKLTPLGIAVDVGDIVNAIDFVLKSQSMTGEVITLDSGQSLDWKTENFLQCKE